MDEREMFEAWADQEGISVRRCTHLDDIYASPASRVAWRAWQIGRRNMHDRECEWKCDDIDNGIWESSCGESWSFIDGGPVENRMLFCHRCGGKLKTAPTSDQGGA